MKKWVALVLAAVMIFAVTASLAEEKTFDLSLVEKLPNYEYDKMEKKWRAYGAYLKKYSDATVVVGINISGDKNGCNVPDLYCWIREANNRTTFADVLAIKILIDDELFTAKPFVDTSESDVFLGENGKKLVQAIAGSSEMMIRLGYGVNSIDLELNAEKDYADLKKLCKGLVETDVWAYVDDEQLWLETMYGFVVE